MGKVKSHQKNPYPKCFEPLFSFILYYFLIVFKNKYKKTINYGYFIELYIKIIILMIFFKYVKIIMKWLG